MQLRSTGAQRTQSRNYAAGDILRPKYSTSLDVCGVVIGWDDWLRPLVLCITVRAGSVVPRLQVLPLDEFGARDDLEVVRLSFPVEPMDNARDITFTDVMWGRARQLLKGATAAGPQGRSCEDIARFVITGEGVSQLEGGGRLAA